MVQLDFKELVNQTLSDLLSQAELPPEFVDALSYVLLSQGKRLRPCLALTLYHDLFAEKGFDSFLKASIALEFVHVSSLIHDDLPGLDNDTERRGLPTCHVKFGEGRAVLVADYLISWSGSLISKSSYSQANFLLAELLKTYGDICIGQELDLYSEITNLGQYQKMVALKTGSLLTCSVLFPLLGNVPEVVQVKFLEFAQSFGLLFQLENDYQDLFGDMVSRGRTESSDLRNHKFRPFVNKKDAQNVLAEQLADCRYKLDAAANRHQYNRFYTLIDSYLSKISVA